MRSSSPFAWAAWSRRINIGQVCGRGGRAYAPAGDAHIRRSRVNLIILLTAHRISPIPTTALAGVGCRINTYAALQVPLPSTRTLPSTFSATLFSPPHTSSMRLFLRSALSTRFTCETPRSFPALRNAAICSSAPMMKAPAHPLKKLPEARASILRPAIWRSG
jgi:hypothetical protein